MCNANGEEGNQTSNTVEVTVECKSITKEIMEAKSTTALKKKMHNEL